MKVLTISDPKVRSVIEQFTEQNCKPDVVKFIQDGNGNWITAPENLLNKKFTFEKVVKGETTESIRIKLSTETTKESLQSSVSIADLIDKYAVLIDYVPVPDVIEEPPKEGDGELKEVTTGSK